MDLHDGRSIAIAGGIVAINCDQGEGEGDQLRSERAIKGDQNVVVYI